MLPASSSCQEISVNAESKMSTSRQSGRNAKKSKFPDDALPDLIRLLHGNKYGRRFIMKEFMTFWNKNNKIKENQLSKASVLKKINELATKMACPEEGPMHLTSCWYVPEDIRKQYFSNDLPLPNNWNYILTPNRKIVQTATNKLKKKQNGMEKQREKDNEKQKEKNEEKQKEKEKEKEKKYVPLITHFTKKITQEEMKKQLTVKSDHIFTAKSPQQKLPKRATLISVPRGEQFPGKSRNSTLTQFVDLHKGKEQQADSGKALNVSNDIIFLENTNKDKANKKLLLNNELMGEESKKLLRIEITEPEQGIPHDKIDVIVIDDAE